MASPKLNKVKKKRKKRAPSQPKGKITARKIAVWQLRSLGYPISMIAQNLDMTVQTATRYNKEVRTEYSDLPSVRGAIDTLATKIPDALKVAEKCIKAGLKPGAKAKELRIAWDTAKDILNNFKVLTEKTEQNLADQRDRDLIREAERIIARRQGAAVSDNG